MKWHGVVLYNNGDFQFTRPYVFTDGAWKTGTWWIHDGSAWRMIGGACTMMVPFFDSANSPFIVSGDQMYVRQLIGAKLKDSGGNYLKDSDGKMLFGDYRGP